MPDGGAGQFVSGASVLRSSALRNIPVFCGPNWSRPLFSIASAYPYTMRTNGDGGTGAFGTSAARPNVGVNTSERKTMAACCWKRCPAMMPV
jgi:hypothetical protein